MYLFDHYICFYSNIFGFESKKIIPFEDVTTVRRAKTAGIFPNAIEIVAAGKKHFFASFLSRDEAFKLIVEGWSYSGNAPKELLDQLDSKSESSSQMNGVCSVQNGNSSDFPNNDCDSDERNLEVSNSGDTKSSLNHIDDDVRPSSQEVPDTGGEERDASFVAGPSTSPASNWKQETRDAPEIPKSYNNAGESKFPITVEEFYNYFFSEDAVGFVESYHKACGDRDFKCTSWTPCEKFGFTRQKSFQHPIKLYFGAKCGGCKETQKYQVYKNSHLVIETSQEVSDVPYADYFTVEGIWDVQKDDNESKGCILRVYVSVAFSKRTIWKGKIEQSTMEECRETYSTWIDLAHKLLTQKNIEKREGIVKSKVEQIEQRNTETAGDHAERSHVSSETRTITETVSNTFGNHERTGKFWQGSLLHATTVTSTVKAFAIKLGSFLRSRGNLQQFLVITFSVILILMQLSIVVLLSKPQQVYVIPQADHFSSVSHASGQRTAETIAWMEKRVHLLKDEMFVVEGQLERMRHEHIMLKAQLKDLERLIHTDASHDHSNSRPTPYEGS
ncbi:protein VASCULAR ASSOCIATED DEATH 1, chloroplastic-like isoform X2 [Silene latifolia]